MMAAMEAITDRWAHDEDTADDDANDDDDGNDNDETTPTTAATI